MSVANSSPKAPSRSSVTSSNMLDRQLELVRARELARKNRQVLEAERKELELDAEIAALSSHRSNASGVSSVNKRYTGASSQTHAFEELTEDNLFDHTRKLREGPVLEEYEPTSPEEEFMPLPFDFDHDAAEQAMRNMIRQHEVQRQALQAQVSQEASITIDEKPCEGPLLQMFNDATFDCNRSSAACIISYPQAPIPSPVQVFQNSMLVQGDLIARQQQMSVANVEQNVINMAESRYAAAVNTAESRHASAIHDIQQEANVAHDNRLHEVVAEATGHIEAAHAQARAAEFQARTAELMANDKIKQMQFVMQAELTRKEEDMKAEVLRVQVEAELKVRQSHSKQGSAASVTSTFDVSTPHGTPRTKIVPSFFEKVFASPARIAMTYAPTTVSYTHLTLPTTAIV